MAFKPGEAMTIVIFSMAVIGILIIFFTGRMTDSNIGIDVFLGGMLTLIGALLLFGAFVLFYIQIKTDVKDEVLQHLNLTKDVEITLDERNEFQYELRDSTYTNLFNYLTQEKTK